MNPNRRATSNATTMDRALSGNRRAANRLARDSNSRIRRRGRSLGGRSG